MVAIALAAPPAPGAVSEAGGAAPPVPPAPPKALATFEGSAVAFAITDARPPSPPFPPGRWSCPRHWRSREPGTIGTVTVSA